MLTSNDRTAIKKPQKTQMLTVMVKKKCLQFYRVANTMKPQKAFKNDYSEV